MSIFFFFDKKLAYVFWSSWIFFWSRWAYFSENYLLFFRDHLEWLFIAVESFFLTISLVFCSSETMFFCWSRSFLKNQVVYFRIDFLLKLNHSLESDLLIFCSLKSKHFCWSLFYFCWRRIFLIILNDFLWWSWFFCSLGCTFLIARIAI